MGPIVMIKRNYTGLIILLLSLISCIENFSKSEIATKSRQEITIKDCQLFYNNNHVLLGKKLDYYLKCFGKNYRTVDDLNNKVVWDSLGICIYGNQNFKNVPIEKDTFCVVNIVFNYSFRDYSSSDKRMYPLKEYNGILNFEGIQILKGTSIKELISKSSNFSGQLNRDHMYGYSMKSKCSNEKVKYFFDTPTSLDIESDDNGKVHDNEIIEISVIHDN